MNFAATKSFTEIRPTKRFPGILGWRAISAAVAGSFQGPVPFGDGSKRCHEFHGREFPRTKGRSLNIV